MGLSLMNMLVLSSSVRIAFIARYWKRLLSFHYTVYWLYDATRAAQKTLHPAVSLLLHVYSLQWERVNVQLPGNSSLMDPLFWLSGIRRDTQPQTARWSHKSPFIFSIVLLCWWNKRRLSDHLVFCLRIRLSVHLSLYPHPYFCG
jgi:hypothetical protein